jgi:hypothetical protein
VLREKMIEKGPVLTGSDAE